MEDEAVSQNVSIDTQRSSPQPVPLAASAKALARRVVSRALWLVRPRLPLVLVRPFVERKIRRALADPATMTNAGEHMEHLLGAVGRSSEVEAGSRGYVEHWAWCHELRWHPRSVTRQRVEGIEHLLAARSEGHGVFLSFVHHAHFDGAFASVSRAGVPVHVLVGARAMRTAGPNLLQHLHVVGKGGALMSAEAGTSGIADELRKGHVVAAAIDVPGGSVATFAGRQVRCSSGPARAAFFAGSPVVVMTSHRSADGTTYLQLSEPLHPRDFDSVELLLAELVRRHEGPLLAWPDAAYIPMVCWKPVEPEDA